MFKRKFFLVLLINLNIGCGYIHHSFKAEPIPNKETEPNNNNNNNSSPSILSIQKQFLPNNLSLNEGGSLIIILTLNAPVDYDNHVEVKVEGSNGEPSESLFSIVPKTLTLPAGSTSISTIVTSIDDNTYHYTNQWLLKLSSNNLSLNTQDTLSFHLIDNDPNPHLPSNINTQPWSNKLNQTPILTFTNGSMGETTIDHYEAKIFNVTTNTVITTYQTIDSGHFISNLNLTNGQIYKFILRAVDHLGNFSSEVESNSWKIDATPPSPPGAITTGFVTLNFKQETPLFTFAESTDNESGFSHYLIEIRNSVNDSIVKSYSSGIGNGSVGLRYKENYDFLVANESYYVNIKSVDIAGNMSSATTALNPWTAAIACPPNFVLSPFLSPHNSKIICVAKYEMKLSQNDGTPVNDGRGTTNVNVSLYKPESRASGTPWTRLTLSEARSECSSLGSNYRLIINSEWDALANDIAAQSENWSQGKLRSGHTDSAMDANALANGWTFPNSATLLAAGNDDSNGYEGTGNNAGQSYGSGGEQNRILILSNNQALWDLSGNSRELVDMDGLGGYLSYTGGAISAFLEVNAVGVTNIVSTLVSSNGTTFDANTFKSYNSSWTHSVENIGKIYLSGGQRTNRILTRGGNFDDANAPGLFAADINSDSTARGSSAGFRCVYQLP